MGTMPLKIMSFSDRKGIFDKGLKKSIFIVKNHRQLRTYSTFFKSPNFITLTYITVLT